MNAAPARVGWPWLLSAAALIVFTGGVWWIGPQFIFGENHAQRPIWTFLALYGVGWTGFAIAAVALRTSRPPLFFILGVALVTRSLLLDSNLIQSSDVYRYVLDGEAVLNGIDPYQHAPEDLADEAPEHFRAQLRSEAGSRVLARVSYPDIRTIYPPLAQGAFAIGAWLTPWDWLGQRIVFTICDLWTIGLLVALLRDLKLPRAWVLLYAWNPLVLKEIANSAHADSLVALCIVTALYGAVRGEQDERWHWPMLTGAGLSGAVLCKLYPLVLVPAFAAFWFARTNRYRALFAFLAAFAGVTFVSYVPSLNVGFDAMTEGLRRYAIEWQRNEGLFALIHALAPDHARILANVSIALGAVAGAAWLYRNRAPAESLVAVVQYTLLGWLLLLPAVYPWYAVPLLAVCAARPRAWAVVLSGALALYYYSFIHEYRGHPDGWAVAARAIEHGLVLAALTIGVYSGINRKGTGPAALPQQGVRR